MEKESKLNLIEVGKRVREVREAKHLSGAALGNAIGYSQNVISKIERGVNAKANIDTLKAIAKVCGCSEDYLLLRSDFKSRAEMWETIWRDSKDQDIIRTKYLEMIMSLHGFKMNYLDGDDFIRCNELMITDSAGNYVHILKNNIFDLVLDFEAHFSFQIQRLIDNKLFDQELDELNRKEQEENAKESE